MESYPLINSPTIKRNISYSRRPSKIFSLFMWHLGLIEWSNPVASYGDVDLNRLIIIDRPTWERRALFLTSMMFLLIMTLGSLFTATWNCVCYYGSLDHLLPFTSFTFFYWPILMSSQVVCIIAAIKNYLKQPGKEIKYTYANIFSEQSFARKWYTRSKYFKTTRLYEYATLAFFYLIAGVNSYFELQYFFSLDIDCRPWPKYVCLVFHICGLFFFTTFCSFLFLLRSILDENAQHTVWYVREHCPNLEACIHQVGQLFSHYYQLRKLLLPWLNFVLFSTTFGLTAFFSWEYHEATSRNATTIIGDGSYDFYQIEWGFNKTTNISEFCRVNCEYGSVTHNNIPAHKIYDILVFCEKLMVVAFALFIVGGIDLKYKWDRFKLKVNMTYTSDDAAFWKHLHKFVRHLHPDTLNDTLVTYIIPLIGIALGVISNGQFRV